MKWTAGYFSIASSSTLMFAKAKSVCVLNMHSLKSKEFCLFYLVSNHRTLLHFDNKPRDVS